MTPSNKTTLALIPARYASTRFPGKPLVQIAGKTMIQRVWEQVRATPNINEVYIATDDPRIQTTAQNFGAKVLMTQAQLASGTDRCAQALSQLEQKFDYIINVQGDEPFVRPEQLQQLITLLQQEPWANISTLKQALAAQDLHNPNIVKVVAEGPRALYFSRNALPHYRDNPQQGPYYRHLGLYAFRAEILPQLAQLKLGQLEQAEQLEQLRWLGAGYTLAIGETQAHGPAVDTPQDLQTCLDYMQNQGLS